MRRFLPDSLTAWALLIVIAGLAVTEIATIGAILDDHARSARLTGLFRVAERVMSLSRAIAAEPAAGRSELARVLATPTVAVGVDRTPIAASRADSDEEIAELESILKGRLGDIGIAEVDVGRGQAAEPIATAGDDPPGAEAGPLERLLDELEERYSLADAYLVSVQLEDGNWINFSIPTSPPARLWTTRTVLLTTLALLLVLAGSIWALRRLTVPYRLLAEAAERLGRDLHAPSLREDGPGEIRGAARAFNVMQARIQRLIGDRDQLVAAISHDLRTPVTRLRLRAEFVEDGEQRARMLSDLDAIETMTSSVLTFARNSAEPEARETIDLISLLESVCTDVPDVAFELPPGLPPRLRAFAQPVGLRRALANLVENAVKYGRHARVSVRIEPAFIRISVDDDGPGIPEEEIEAVFRPFRRLETSRSRETGGTGLGLTIARAVARAHGGDVILRNRPEGGLTADFVLPHAAAPTPLAEPKAA